LLGHAAEMIENTNVGMVIYAEAVPVFPEAKELAAMGMIPGGLYRNRDFRKSIVEFKADVSEFWADILFDPQTSGGLLISVPKGKAERMLDRLHQAGITKAAIIGEIVDNPKGKIVLFPTKAPPQF